MTSPYVFCALLSGVGNAEWVWRGDAASALLPLHPAAPGHMLIISNEHAVGVQDASPDSLSAVVLLVQRISRRMASVIGAVGVNVLNASGEHSDQSVGHLHFHVLPRWADDGLDTWIRGRSSHELTAGWLDDLRGGFSTDLS